MCQLPYKLQFAELANYEKSLTLSESNSLFSLCRKSFTMKSNRLMNTRMIWLIMKV